MKLSTKHWSALAAVAITGLTLILLWPNQPKEGPTEPQEVGRAYPQAVPQTQPPSPPTKESELTKTDSTESPTPLALLTGETPGKYAERIVAFNEVTNQDLDAPTLTTLLDYLKKPNGHPRNGRPDLVEAAIKNDIIDWLRGRRPLIRELTETLITIGADPTQPIVMRDYALQLLGSWAGDLQKTRVQPTTTPPQAEPTWIPDALAEIETVLWTATEAKDHSYAGTALLSLHRMLEQSSSPGLQSRPRLPQLQTQATTIATTRDYSTLSRATALQLLGTLDPEFALPLARDTLVEESPPELRLAAIGVIGRHSDTADALKTLSESNDPRFAAAIQAARERIEQTAIGNEG